MAIKLKDICPKCANAEGIWLGPRWEPEGIQVGTGPLVPDPERPHIGLPPLSARPERLAWTCANCGWVRYSPTADQVPPENPPGQQKRGV